MDYVKLFLMLISAVSWTLVYISCIRIGFHQKTYCIPFWALALNFTWEIWHDIFDLRELGPQLQVIINAVWLIFDTIVLYTYFKYGKKYLPKSVRQSGFIPGVSFVWLYRSSFNILLLWNSARKWVANA
jgi:hypothetical protein